MNAEGHIALGRSALEAHDYETARRHFVQAGEADASSSTAHFYLGVVEAERGRDREALVHYLRCLELGGRSANLFNNIGAVQSRLGRIEDAERSYCRALEAQHDHPQACAALGRLLQERGDFDGALALYERALHDQASGYLAAFHKSQILLARGELRAGFKWFGSRPNRLFSTQRQRRNFFRGTFPGRLHGVTVLVLSEASGIGDDLFFARFLPELKARGASVVLACGARLRSLLEPLACIDAFVTLEAEDPASDYCVFAGDLPYALRVWEWPALPPPAPLAPPPALQRQAVELLERHGCRPFIGVTWRAGTDARPAPAGVWEPMSKRMPVEPLANALAGLGGTVFVLQRQVEPADLAAVRERIGAAVVDLSDQIADLGLTLALLALLEHYFCVPNTHLHLRVSAGRGAHIFEPFPPDWRLELHGEASRWYPGCRVYRQAQNGSWEGAFAKLYEALGASTAR